jgi:hypothetical protein
LKIITPEAIDHHKITAIGVYPESETKYEKTEQKTEYPGSGLGSDTGLL